MTRDWHILIRQDGSVRAAGPLAHCESYHRPSDRLVPYRCEICGEQGGTDDNPGDQEWWCDPENKLVSVRQLDGTVTYRHEASCLKIGTNV